jgi:hypothetical protein
VRGYPSNMNKLISESILAVGFPNTINFQNKIVVGFTFGIIENFQKAIV